jgi:hypothetical protein
MSGPAGAGRPPRLVLFIGHHKAGSSALQRFLSGNWLALARAGILYPAVESQGLSLTLAAALSGRETDGAPPMNLREAHNALAFRMISEVTGAPVPPWHPRLPHSAQMFAAIENQVAALRPQAVTLCSEVMSNFGAISPDLIARLRGLFPGAPVRLLCTLRRPDEYLASWHGQRLKFGHRPPPLRADGLQGYWEGVHFDYRRLLEPWLEAFPEAELRLRDYGALRAAGGSVEDFARQSGLRFPRGLQPGRDANPSLPRATMEIARRANAELEAEAAGRLRAHLIAARDRLPLPPDAEVEMFGADNRAELLARFRPIDAWLGEQAPRRGLDRLRPGRPGFFPDLEEAARPRPRPELEAAAEALAALRADRERARLPEAARDFLETVELG